MRKVVLAIAVIAMLVLSAYGYTKDNDKKSGPKGKWTKDSVYKCYRADSEIKIDGILDDPAWKKADVISDLWQGNSWNSETNKVVPGHFESQKTRARLLYDDNYVYVCGDMHDTDVLGMTTINESEFIDGIDDMFEMFFKPDRKKPGYYELHVMPQNVIRDLFIAKRGAGSYLRFEKEYNSGMQTAVRIDGTINNYRDVDNGWSVEVRIPMSAFEETGGGPKAGDRWQFLISRYNFAFQLPLGVELVQMVGMDQVNFHLHETYPTIEFVK